MASTIKITQCFDKFNEYLETVLYLLRNATKRKGKFEYSNKHSQLSASFFAL